MIDDPESDSPPPWVSTRVRQATGYAGAIAIAFTVGLAWPRTLGADQPEESHSTWTIPISTKLTSEQRDKHWLTLADPTSTVVEIRSALHLLWLSEAKRSKILRTLRDHPDQRIRLLVAELIRARR